MDYFSLATFSGDSKPTRSCENSATSASKGNLRQRSSTDSLKVANLLSPVRSTAENELKSHGGGSSSYNDRDNYKELNGQFTNPIQRLLSLQEQATSFSTQKTTANFFSITQYILQSYFKVDVSLLSSLKLVDLVVDHSCPDSLTLRRLSDPTSHNGRYQYFNTVSRDPDISKCPIFALSVYFIIRWSHPNPSITISNYGNISLLDPLSISYDSSPLTFTPGTGISSSTERVAYSLSFEPSEKLVEYVFPWLPILKQNMLLYDRTNYRLYSFCELFSFMARVIIQDLFYLKQHSLLLPNIVTFISKFIPDLLQQEEFRGPNSADLGPCKEKTPNKGKTDLQSSHISGLREDASFKDLVVQQVDSRFLELSRKLTTENIRLSQQISQLKTDLSSLTSLCNEILRLQQRSLPAKGDKTSHTEDSVPQGTGLNGVAPEAEDSSLQESDTTAAKSSQVVGDKKDNGLAGGILILDRDSLNANLLTTLLHSLTGKPKLDTSSNQPPDSAAHVTFPQGDLPSVSASTVPPSVSNSSDVLPSQSGGKKEASSQALSYGTEKLPNLTADEDTYVQLSRLGGSSIVSEGPITKRPRLDVRQTVSQNQAGVTIPDSRPDSKPTVQSIRQDISLSPVATTSVQTVPDTSSISAGPVTSTELVQAENGPVQPTDHSLPSEVFAAGETSSKLETTQKTAVTTQIDNSPSTLSDRVNVADSAVTVAYGSPAKMNQNLTSNPPTITAPGRELSETSLTRCSPQEVTTQPLQQSQAPIDSTATRMWEDASAVTAHDEPVYDGATTNSVISSVPDNAARVPLRRNSHSEVSLAPNSVIPRPPSDPIRPKKCSTSGSAPTKVGPNDNIKYKLSRDNKTVWDLYTEWYIGFNGKLSIKKLIENYGWRRWKVSEDSHFFPTRRVIMDYIETEVDRGVKYGRFMNVDESRDDIRRIIVGDLEKFRIDNGLTLNSLSLYFRNLTKNNKEICIFEDFKSWKIRLMSEDEKIKYCKRQYTTTLSTISDDQNTVERKSANDRSGKSAAKPPGYTVELSELCPPTTIDPNTGETISSDVGVHMDPASQFANDKSKTGTTSISQSSDRPLLPSFLPPSIINAFPQAGSQSYTSVGNQGSPFITEKQRDADSTSGTVRGPIRGGTPGEAEIRITDDVRSGKSATPESIGTPVLTSS